MGKIKDFKELAERINALKASGQIDLSTEEDLSIGIMNLISLEEHFFFSAEKTGKKEYLDMLSDVRDMRKELLAKLMDKNEAESWCISKHLLAGSMRLMEVGTKLQTQGDKQGSEDYFDKAYKLYAMFWALRLKILSAGELKDANLGADSDKPWSAEDIVSKLVDCCKE
jgi:hypothetical protein